MNDLQSMLFNELKFRSETKEDSAHDKQFFQDLLKSTNREGIDKFLDYLSKTSFYQDPASASHHMNIRGGLLQHSLNTYHVAMQLWKQIESVNPKAVREVTRENIILASLLHDIGKVGTYKETTVKQSSKYNDLQKQKTKFRVKGYYELQIPHEERSIITILQTGLKLEQSELLAILYHMSVWSAHNKGEKDITHLNNARERYPLVLITSIADEIASQLLERNT